MVERRAYLIGMITAVHNEVFAKEQRLAAWLSDAVSVLVGYSGGVDSSYLAVVAREVLGRDHCLAVLGRSPSVPGDQWRSAVELAEAHDLAVVLMDTDEVSDPRYAANPVNRCYYCKAVLWSVLGPMALERGMAVVVDGTNADDLREYRPGARAANEAGVRSPLAEVGLAKDEIRVLSRRRGLATWDQPAAPCLSSRIPYGLAVTPTRLAEVERAEAALRASGVTGNLRVRHHGDLARVELDANELDAWLVGGRAQELAQAVRSAGFARVSIDLRGFRSGSLNVLEGVTA
jgi:uncharacterized protein